MILKNFEIALFKKEKKIVHGDKEKNVNSFLQSRGPTSSELKWEAAVTS